MSKKNKVSKRPLKKQKDKTGREFTKATVVLLSASLMAGSIGYGNGLNVYAANGELFGEIQMGNSKTVTKITLEPSKLGLIVGKSAVLTPVAIGEIQEEFTWSSSNEEIATVENGKVTAIKAGTAIITVTAKSGETGTCEVTVKTKLKDVPEDSWKYSAAEYVYLKDIMTIKDSDENGDVIFAPDENLNREEFAKILYDAEGEIEVPYKNYFSDVEDKKWYTQAILFAVNLEIVSGYNNGKFGVGDKITREQLAVMLYKYAVYKKYDTTARGSLDKFTDVDKVHSWAKEQLQWAVSNGVISGKGKRLDPLGYATRAECAAMLRSFFVKFEEAKEKDKVVLDKTIIKAETLTETAYTAESYATVKKALEAAKLIIEDENATQEEISEAIKALEAAIKALEEKSEVITNKALLDETIKSAEALKEADYTANSYNALKKALDEAKTIISNSEATQIMIDNARADLIKAMDALVKKADKTTLKAEIAKAEALKEDDYTSESYQEVKDALEAAKAVEAKEEATQAEVDRAAAALVVAGIKLVEKPVINKTALNAAISQAEALNADDYTEESYQAVQTALTEAKKVAENAEATQTEVDRATADLTTALSKLAEKPVIDKTALNTAISQAEALNAEIYTAESYQAVQTALTEAKQVAGNTQATQIEVDNAATNLTIAIGQLVEKPVVDKTALNAAISRAEALTAEAYTPESYQAVQTALVEARQAAGNAEATQEEVDSAAANLTAAIEALEEISEVEVNKEALRQAIVTAEALNASDYTEESYQAVQTALTSAKTIEAKEEATQTEVDGATAALITAINNLVEKIVVDKTALNTAISQAEALNAGDYTSDSYQAVQTALAAAKTVAGNAEATQAEVNDAAAALTTAISKLVNKPVTDKNALNAAISQAEALNAGNYTEDSYQAVQTALAAAKTVAGNIEATQEEIDSAAAALTTALSELTEKPKPVVDKTALDAAISKADALTGDDYTEESYQALQEVLIEAMLVSDNAEATQEEVDNATEALTAAIEALEEVSGVEVNKTDLKAAIARAENLNEDDYTSESYQAVQTALETAKTIDAKENATQAEVDSAKSALIAAIGNLVNKPVVDRTALNKAIEEAKALTAEAYTPESYQAVQAALTEAEKVVKDTTATQEIVNKAANDLRAAIEALEEVSGVEVDKTALKAAIARAEALNEGDYTSESYQTVQTALETAKIIDAKQEATQKEVDSAKSALIAAIDNLINKPVVDKTALNEAIEEAKTLTVEAYTPESYQVVQAALTEAEKVVKDTTATQEMVNKAASDLRAAIEALEEVSGVEVDKTALKAAIAQAEDLTPEDYTSESYQAVKSALEAAKLIDAKEEAIQTEVDSATTVLKEAIDALVKVDKTALRAKIAEAEGLKEADYTPTSFAKLKTALENAKKVEAAVTTKELVEAAVESLENAIAGLIRLEFQVFKKFDFGTKKGTANGYERIANAAYTTEQKYGYNCDSQATIDYGNVGAYSEMTADDAELQAALNDLAYVKDGDLIFLVDLEAGIYKIDIYAGYGYRNTEYDTNEIYVNDMSLGTVNRNTDAKEIEKSTIITLEEASQITIRATNPGKRAFLNAVIISKVKVSKTALNEAITKAESLNEAEYTAESWSSMQGILTMAKALVQNADATQEQVDNAVAELTEVISALKKKPVDKTELQAKITEAESLKSTGSAGYTTESWNRFTSALETANTTNNNTEATKEEVAQAVTGLTTAIDGLRADKSELQAKIEEIESKSLVSTDYVSTSWNALEKALQDAKDINEKEKATKEEVATALADLTAKFGALVRKADKAALQTAIDEAKDLKEADYVSAGWTVFAEALDSANIVNGKEDATQDEVNEALKNLNDAKDALKKKADKAELRTAINQANALNKTDYLMASWTIFANALDSANTVNGKEDATQNEVNEALESLTNAKNALVNITNLQNAITKAKGLTQANYTEESFAKVTEALDAAEKLLTNDTATQEAVNNATNNLTTAIDNLELKSSITVNKDLLKAEIAIATSVEGEKYTPSSYEVFEEALNAANAIMNDEQATQESVNSAKDALISAREKLVLRADKTVLTAAIEAAEVKAQQEETYTPTTYAELTRALGEAQTVANNLEATQEATNAAATALQQAIDGLVERANKTALNAAIEAAEAKKQQEETYTPTTYAELIKALGEAQTVANNLEATQEATNAAATALQQAIDGLVEKANKEALNAAIVDAKNLNEEDYISGWAELQTTIAEVEALVSNENATQEEVNDAVTALNNAIKALEKKGDKTALTEVISKANNLVEADYTTDSYGAVKTALDAAKLVAKNQDATQAVVDKAVTDLNQAIEALVPNKETLNAKIAKAEGLQRTNEYTEETYNALTAALKTAKTISGKEDATLQEVKDAVASLTEKLAGLQEKALQEGTETFLNAATNWGMTGDLTSRLSIAKDEEIGSYAYLKCATENNKTVAPGVAKKTFTEVPNNMKNATMSFKWYVGGQSSIYRTGYTALQLMSGDKVLFQLYTGEMREEDTDKSSDVYYALDSSYDQKTTGTKVTKGNWYDVKISMNFEDGTIKVLLDEKEIVIPETMLNAHSIDAFAIATYHGGESPNNLVAPNVGIDNFLFTYEEGEAIEETAIDSIELLPEVTIGKEEWETYQHPKVKITLVNGTEKEIEIPAANWKASPEFVIDSAKRGYYTWTADIVDTEEYKNPLKMQASYVMKYIGATVSEHDYENGFDFIEDLSNITTPVNHFSKEIEQEEDRYWKASASGSGGRYADIALGMKSEVGMNVSFDWKPMELSVGEGQFLFDNYFTLSFKTDNKLYYVAKNGTSVDTRLSGLNKWYHVDLKFDYQKHTVDISITERDNESQKYEITGVSIAEDAKDLNILKVNLTRPSGTSVEYTMGMDNLIIDITKKVDKTELAQKLEEAGRLEETEYTSESWTVLANALNNANSINNKEDATQEEVNSALEELKNAIEALNPKEGLTVNKENLEAAITKATSLKEMKENNTKKYEAKSEEAMLQALTAAESVAGAEKTTQSAVDNATKALNDAIAALIEILYEQDFSKDFEGFTLVTNGSGGLQSSDKATVNVNTTQFLQVLGGNGERALQSSSAMNFSQKELVFEADIRLDAPAGSKTSSSASEFHLLASRSSKLNWVEEADQKILSIVATVPQNTSSYYSSITINGTELINEIPHTNSAESGSTTLQRDTTGWLHITAKPDFENKTIYVKLEKMTTRDKVYEGTFNFVSQDADALRYVFLRAGKTYGAASIDNVLITAPVESNMTE